MTSLTGASTLFDLNLHGIIELDSSKIGKKVEIPILIQELLSPDLANVMIETEGVFRKSCSIGTITELKSDIIKVYEKNADL